MIKINTSFHRILVVYVVLLSSLQSSRKISLADDTMDSTQNITPNETLVSSGGKFELGFFTPGESGNWYVGIWYKNIDPSTVVWVASRETPIENSTAGVLKIVEPGILVLVNGTGGVVWSTYTTRVQAVKSPVLQLLDSGNLILRDENDPVNYLWQSFDNPTDTLLPGMQFGANSLPGGNNYLSSWTSAENPARGEYTLRLDVTGYPQAITRQREVELYRLGPWNGKLFSGTAESQGSSWNSFGVFRNTDGAFYAELDDSVSVRYTIDPTGVCRSWQWVDQAKKWVEFMKNPRDDCDNYNGCGPYSTCTIGSLPICGCLDRFVPKDPKGWVESDWSQGCVRRSNLSCEDDGFLPYTDIKFPDARNCWYDERMTLDECRVRCLKNCSCMAYSSLNVTNGGTGCLLWFGNLVDIRALSGQDHVLYIRMASSELGSKRRGILIASVTIVGSFLLGLILLLLVYIRKRKKKNAARNENDAESRDMELPLFELSVLSRATNSFAFQNKLGEGGYGPVYKGTLDDGQEIAVKRLSKTSKQGIEEFKNEVFCIAKLQHRNLVSLLGCCIEGNEKMLVYEYMPNKSLDWILFDKGPNRTPLDWRTRFNIVVGIARGLMYLHHDSSLRMIHRDLKASNILLDKEMNAKISDFGIARTYGEDQTEYMTSRVMGTYGYMSPEYAVGGRFSMKSDVFSFGVIVLEIVSGRKNSSYAYGPRHLNLLGHAWMLHKEGRSLELVDNRLRESNDPDQAQRLIHVGLLCVQQRPDDRPSMTSVIAMLSRDNKLPQANHPGFFMAAGASSSTEESRSTTTAATTNEITMTLLQGR